jgi:hypothetical protein
MTISHRMTISRAIACAALLLLGASTAHAQSPAGMPGLAQKFDIVLAQSGLNVDPLTMPGTFGSVAMDFHTMPFAFAEETVIGAPYSAEPVTEMIQTLADGNRIVRKSSAAVYRDSAGRTRREQGLAVLGQMVGGPDRQLVHITDPEAGVNFSLDMQTHTAHKMPVPRITFDSAYTPATAIGSTFQVPVPPPSAGGVTGDVVFHQRSIAATRMAAVSGTKEAPVVEQLGTQVIEGVAAEGVRSTTTIPAGAIGNEQPISVVSERWTSPELKVLVLSRQSDPRFGETVYRLTNIVRAEPSAALFQVPPDFQVVEPRMPEGGMMEKMKLMEKIKK